MRVAIVSDIHSNLAALNAVLADAADAGAEALWCLGDTVGYGAEPSAVIAILRAHDALAVAGNHDRAACGLLDTEEFNAHAASAIRWTQGQLPSAEIDYLVSLPLTATSGPFTLVHGSLRSPVWEYLLDADQATAHFALQPTPYGLVGHSHLLFSVTENGAAGPLFTPAEHGDVIELAAERLILNPGSVGQPRDGDPRAGYMLYDQGAATMTFRRVPYDIRATQQKMCDAGIDQWLIDRLAVGR